MRCFLLLVLSGFALTALGSPLADGDVTVFLDNGDVVVIGDDASNDIIHEAEGDLAIRGRNGTTVNGSAEPFFLPPVEGRYFVDLGEGDDTFTTSTVLRPNSELHMGNGTDLVQIGNSTASGRGLLIDTGAGDDIVDVQDSSFGRLKIMTGRGSDLVSFLFADADLLAIQTGSGDDTVNLSESTFTGRVSIMGGGGHDEFFEDNVSYLGTPPRIRGFEAP